MHDRVRVGYMSASNYLKKWTREWPWWMRHPLLAARLWLIRKLLAGDTIIANARIGVPGRAIRNSEMDIAGWQFGKVFPGRRLFIVNNVFGGQGNERS